MHKMKSELRLVNRGQGTRASLPLLNKWTSVNSLPFGQLSVGVSAKEVYGLCSLAYYAWVAYTSWIRIWNRCNLLRLQKGFRYHPSFAPAIQTGEYWIRSPYHHMDSQLSSREATKSGHQWYVILFITCIVRSSSGLYSGSSSFLNLHQWHNWYKHFYGK